MELNKTVLNAFDESAKLKMEVVHDLAPIIVDAGQLMSDCLLAGGKILACGNGGSASDADHFVGEILGRFQKERDSLPAVSLVSSSATLTAVANDYGYENIFSRQIQGLGKKDDVLLAISTSGNSENIIAAIDQAHKLGMRVIALIGKDGGKMLNTLQDDDLAIVVSHSVTARIQEVHILAIHCICELIDKLLFEQK